MDPVKLKNTKMYSHSNTKYAPYIWLDFMASSNKTRNHHSPFSSGSYKAVIIIIINDNDWETK